MAPKKIWMKKVEYFFFNKLDLEIQNSFMAGALVCVQMDANSKLGPNIIPGDPDEQSRNGKALEKVIKDNDLIVVNGSDLCKGSITRYRKTVNKEEKSIIDFFLVCRNFYKLIKSLLIDEERIHTLTKYCRKNGTKNVKESDHNVMIMI